MIEKLDTHNVTQDVLVTKLNEVIDALNKVTDPKREQYTDVQRTHMELVSSGQIQIEEVADKWNVAFYDDVPHEFTSPVYCRNCEYRSVSLLDRMLLNPKALCAGCIEKTKWG